MKKPRDLKIYWLNNKKPVVHALADLTGVDEIVYIKECAWISLEDCENLRDWLSNVINYKNNQLEKKYSREM